jgi:hypothetical protein
MSDFTYNTLMKTLALLIGTLISIGSWGSPDSQILLYGNVFGNKIDVLLNDGSPSLDALSGVRVLITSEGKVYHDQYSPTNGKYAAVLDAGKNYVVTFSKSGYLTRTITVDASGLAAQTKTEVVRLYADVTLFTTNDVLAESAFEHAPFAHASYHANFGRMQFDADYRRSAFEAFLAAVKTSMSLAREEH